MCPRTAWYHRPFELKSLTTPHHIGPQPQTSPNHRPHCACYTKAKGGEQVCGLLRPSAGAPILHASPSVTWPMASGLRVWRAHIATLTCATQQHLGSTQSERFLLFFLLLTLNATASLSAAPGSCPARGGACGSYAQKSKWHSICGTRQARDTKGQEMHVLDLVPAHTQ